MSTTPRRRRRAPAYHRRHASTHRPIRRGTDRARRSTEFTYDTSLLAHLVPRFNAWLRNRRSNPR